MEMWKVVFIAGIVYTIYVLSGGVIFMFLDQLDALGMQIRVYNSTAIMYEEMHTLLLEDFSEKEIKDIISGWKREHVKNYFSNKSIELADLRWTYSNAFFFAFHLSSTIGYGNVSPSTAWGQMLAVLYAAIGIPLNILFFKIFGESFAQSYQEVMLKIKGDKDSPNRNLVGNLGFFLLWSIVFFVMPSAVFTYMEDWHFIEGFYYSFITLSTVGLGDYVAGDKASTLFNYTAYKLMILIWMIYGLAFFSVVIDFLTHLLQMRLLFAFKCSWKKCCEFERVYVDIEKMDIHFKLLRAEAIKEKYSMWSVREGTRLAVGFRTNHMLTLAALSERIQGELINLLRMYEEENTIVRTLKIPKDAFPVTIKEYLEKPPAPRIYRSKSV